MQGIVQELEASRFGVVGFDISFPDTGDYLVLITFLSDTKMTWKMTPPRIAIGMTVRMSPGEFRDSDTDSFTDFDSVIGTIQPWIRRIHEDIRAQPVAMEEFDDFRKRLDEHLRVNVPDPKAGFSTAEVAELISKLDALETRLKEMEEKHQITDKELKTLKSVINAAKSDLPEMSKDIWYKTAGGKVWEVMRKVAATGEARQIMTEAARKLLGM